MEDNRSFYLLFLQKEITIISLILIYSSLVNSIGIHYFSIIYSYLEIKPNLNQGATFRNQWFNY